ncbi:hypothetical protein D3C76_169770 [compost metagenome]
MGDNLMPWHKTWMTDIDYDRVDLVKEGANSQAFIKIIKQRGGTTMNLEDILKSLKPEHAAVVTAAIEKAKKDEEMKTAEAEKKAKDAEEKAKASEEEVAKLKGDKTPAAGASEEEILKSIKDPGVKALLEMQMARTKAAEEEVRKNREVAAQQEAIAKAKEVPNLGAEETQLAEIYKKLKSVDETLATDVFGILKSANELLKDGTQMTPVGKSTPATAYATDRDTDAAWGKIEAAADEIAKSRNISSAQAVSAIMKERPDLYEAYMNTLK